MGSSLRSPAEVEGNEGFPPQPEKDLESPSSMPLEDLAASHDSRVRRGQGPHLAKRWEPRGFSRVAAAFLSYDGDLSLPLGLALLILHHNLARWRLLLALPLQNPEVQRSEVTCPAMRESDTRI